MDSGIERKLIPRTSDERTFGTELGRGDGKGLGVWTRTAVLILCFDQNRELVDEGVQQKGSR